MNLFQSNDFRRRYISFLSLLIKDTCVCNVSNNKIIMVVNCFLIIIMMRLYVILNFSLFIFILILFLIK